MYPNYTLASFLFICLFANILFVMKYYGECHYNGYNYNKVTSDGYKCFFFPLFKILFVEQENFLLICSQLANLC